MKRIAALALLLLAAGCRNFESPTAPAAATQLAANAQTERYTLDPPALVLKPGESATIAVHMNGGVSTLGVVFDCDGPCTVAEIRGDIYQWTSDGTITVRALQAGTARIRATSRVFGGTSTIELIGDIRVVPAVGRRRSVRH